MPDTPQDPRVIPSTDPRSPDVPAVSPDEPVPLYPAPHPRPIPDSNPEPNPFPPVETR